MRWIDAALITNGLIWLVMFIDIITDIGERKDDKDNC